MAIEVTIHSTGTGLCSLTTREGDGLTMSFKDGTLSETFLSWKGFQQLLGMKTGKNGKKPPTPAPPAVGVSPTRARPPGCPRRARPALSAGAAGVPWKRSVRHGGRHSSR